MKNFQRLEVCFIAILLFGRFVLIICSPNALSGDAIGYVYTAEYIIAHKGFPLLNLQPNGFPALIVPIVLLSGNMIAIVMQCIHAIMDISVLVTLILIARKLFCIKNLLIPRIIVCAAIALQPFTATMASSVHTEQTVQFLLFFGSLSLFGSFVSTRYSRLGPIIGSLLLGLAAILRFELMLFDFVILSVFWFLYYRKYRYVKTLAKKILISMLCYSIFPLLILSFQYASTYEVGFVNSKYSMGGYGLWLRTWFLFEGEEYDKFVFATNKKPDWPGFEVSNYPERAFDSDDEYLKLSKILAKWKIEGNSNSLDQSFIHLASEKSRRHPIRHYVLLPSLRMIHFWVNKDGAQTYLRVIPLQRPFSTMFVGLVLLLKLALLVTGLIGLYVICLKSKYQKTGDWVYLARLSGANVILRTLELGILGIFVYAGLMEVRYVVIVYPFFLLLSLIGFYSCFSHSIENQTYHLEKAH